MDYYVILGLKYGASKDEIKKAFHRLAHIHHPDKNGGDDKKFKEINNAYQELIKGNIPQPQKENPGNFGFKQYQYNDISQFYYHSSERIKYYQQQKEDKDTYVRMIYEMMNQYTSQKPEQNKQKKWKYDPKRGMVFE